MGKYSERSDELEDKKRRARGAAERSCDETNNFYIYRIFLVASRALAREISRRVVAQRRNAETRADELFPDMLLPNEADEM